MPKHEGTGYRIIGILTIFATVRPLFRDLEVVEWADSNAPPWDAALTDNAAFREAFIRTLGEELTHKISI